MLSISGCASGGGATTVSELDPSIEGDAGADGAAGDGDGHGGGDGDSVRPDGGGLPPPPPHDPNDEDGDGARAGVDCNDKDPTVYPATASMPAAPEICDGKDNDCDNNADTFAIDATTYYPDNDEDGAGNSLTPLRACQQPMGWVVQGGDCDDDDPDVGRSENCVIQQRPVIYVAHHGNDDNSGEGPMQAVRTINVGIARALACPEQACSVKIAAGTYEESVGVADGVSLFGGYSQDFLVRDEVANEVIITSSEERTVTAANLTIPTRLDGLTVRGAILSGDDGRSSYAVWVRGVQDTLTLSRVHIVAGKGANGARGGDGQPTQCEARGGSGGTAMGCNSSTGADGDAGGDPVNAGKGQSGGSNYCAGACPAVGHDGISGGHDGEAGGNGANGPGGKASTDGLGRFVEGAFVATSGEPGARGFHGTGGGGGGSGGTKHVQACAFCDRPGFSYDILGGRGADGAPGGCGGGGGASGSAGGGAFALTLIDAKITLDDARLEGGEGGKGGPGGNGIDGQEGSRETGNNRGGEDSSKCGLIRYYSGAGGLGGVGGHGGIGGGGAGGTGGPSVSLALVGSAEVVEQGTIELVPGVGGAGGEPGAGPGNPGEPGLAGAAVDRTQY